MGSHLSPQLLRNLLAQFTCPLMLTCCLCKLWSQINVSRQLKRKEALSTFFNNKKILLRDKIQELQMREANLRLVIQVINVRGMQLPLITPEGMIRVLRTTTEVSGELQL
jgi:hypothetical protein